VPQFDDEAVHAALDAAVFEKLCVSVSRLPPRGVWWETFVLLRKSDRGGRGGGASIQSTFTGEGKLERIQTLFCIVLLNQLHFLVQFA
jgi:hypothetical protein